MKSGQVRTLHFAIEWVDQHSVTWLEGAFPASYEVEGWKLTLTETRLAAAPAAPMTEDEARSAVMPLLGTWSAELEVEQRLVVMLYYLAADVEPDTTSTRGTVASAGFAAASATAFDATIVIQRDAPLPPDWSWRDTDVTHAARTMCLRPLRSGTRPIADAAYWLSTHLKKWAADGDQTAAERLNVSSGYFNKVCQLGARSDERKVSPASLTLSAEDKESLRSAVEELIRRLHLAESGIPRASTWTCPIGQLRSGPSSPGDRLGDGPPGAPWFGRAEAVKTAGGFGDVTGLRPGKWCTGST